MRKTDCSTCRCFRPTRPPHVHALSRAADEMLLARGTLDFYRLRALADEARHALNSARTALERHKQEHCC